MPHIIHDFHKAQDFDAPPNSLANAKGIESVNTHTTHLKDSSLLWFLQCALKPQEHEKLFMYPDQLNLSLAERLKRIIHDPIRLGDILRTLAIACAKKHQVENKVTCWELEEIRNRPVKAGSPLALDYRGSLEILRNPTVAIIGSRHPTFYGREQAQRFSRQLAQKGFTIVSGGAIGIDTIANTEALRYGASCAVLGSGINKLYPSSNERLFYQMTTSKNGLILSEFDENTPPQKWNFPRRNLTIAKLADFVLIVEASKTSGSLLTAQAALDLNCDIGAIPGPVDSPNSAGTNDIIKNGAFLVETPEEVEERLSTITRRYENRLPTTKYSSVKQRISH